MATAVESSTASSEVVVDREKVCPFLIRVFWKRDGHHRPEEYDTRGKLPANELQVYTWPDATLNELADIIKESPLKLGGRGVRFSFSIVYPDKRGIYRTRVLGSVGDSTSSSRGSGGVPGGMRGMRERDRGERGGSFAGGRGVDAKDMTLGRLGFQPGDFLDVAIYQN